MARTRIDLAQVVSVASILIDEHGLAHLSLSSVATELGVRPSALYTHVDGSDGLHYVVAVHASNGLKSAVRDAAVGVGGREALRSMAIAYREFALDHPGQYAATLAPPPMQRDELISAANELVAVLAQVFRTLGLDTGGSELAAFTLKSGLHGFVAQEVTSSGRADDQFHHLVELLTHIGPTR